MLGSRAIYHDGWKAVTFHPVGPLYDDGLRSNAPFDDDIWELYHVAEDISEVHDRAAEFPDKVAELVELWWAEARRNDVLPLDNRVLEVIAHGRIAAASGDLPLLPGRGPRTRTCCRQRPQPIALHSAGGPRARERGGQRHASCAGLCARRLVASLPRGRLRYIHNLQGQTLYQVVAGKARARPSPGGVPLREGRGRRRAGHTAAGQRGGGHGGRRPVHANAFNEVGIGLTCGYEWGPAVGSDYVAPFPFSGTIMRAEVWPPDRWSAIRWPRWQPSWPSSDTADGRSPRDGSRPLRAGRRPLR